MVLYLIAGHGAGDCGAVGYGYTEAERVRALCAEMKRIGGDNVVYLDPNRDWYRDNGIMSLNIPSTDCLLEVHMDGNPDVSCEGGHVVIWGEYEPDQYDNALANMYRDIFPGRSQLISKRTDLANPHRASVKGINYRLGEFGFITNKGDLDKFNSRLTEIATKTLACFGITKNTVVQPKTEEVKEEVKKITNQSIDPQGSFVVRVMVDDLNLRTEPNIAPQYVKGTMQKGAWTIVEVKNGFGKLKSGIGWIYLENSDWVKILGGTVNTTSAQPKKSNEEIAREVIRGEWGNGGDRKTRLANAGYDYNTIQSIVNSMK